MTLNESIDVFFRQFAQEFVRNRARDIRDRQLLNTEDLLRSLYAKVNSDPANGRFLILVFFKTYGRYQDMSRVYTKAGGQEMIQLLEDWVGKEGVEKFKKGKYAARLSNKTPQQVKNAVAWGIVNKLKNQPRTRKRAWWNKGKTKDIENFYDVLIRLCQEAVASELKTAL
jgi:hypothetical protein